MKGLIRRVNCDRMKERCKIAINNHNDNVASEKSISYSGVDPRAPAAAVISRTTTRSTNLR